MTCDKRRDNVSLKSTASWRRSRPADTKSRGASTPRHRERYGCAKNRCAIDTEPLPWARGDSGHTNGHDVARIPAWPREAVANLRPDEGTGSLSGKEPAGRPMNLVSVNSTPRAVAADDRAWVSKALCKGTDPDELFVRGAAQRSAAVICRHCPVMQECAAEALDNKVEYGIWGGMTERDRRRLLKQHPEIVSWTDFFDRRNTRSV